MRKTSCKNRIFFALTALMLVFCLTLSSCSKSAAYGVTKIGKVSTRNEISSPAENPQKYHFAEGASSYAKTGVSSGLIELRADKKTYSCGIYDSSSKTLWTALPLLSEESDKSDCTAAMVSLRVIGGSDIYLLNSQDNSVAYGTASCKTSKNGINYTYKIFDSAETASAKKYSGTAIGFEINLNIMLTDGNMTAECSYKNITGNKNAYIENIDVLNYFGAYNDTDEDSFLFVPDGCGAIIKTSVFDESFESLSFAVYGSDLSNPKEYSGDAIVPAFGVRKGESAFVALIEDGDAASEIDAEKATSSSGYNRVFSSVNITPCAYEDDTIYISKSATTDKVRICYRFLSGINAGYAGMASAVREQLIRNSVITTGNISSTDHLPFYLSLNGTAEIPVFAGFCKRKVLTSFDQANDMLVRMKNKGISNVTIRYSSVLSGGMNQNDISNVRILSEVGGSKGLEELRDYMTNQNMKLFIDADILSATKNPSGGVSKTIFNQKTSFSPESGFGLFSGAKVKDKFFRTLSNIEDIILEILTFSKDLPVTGLCLNDAGSILYSDFSKGGLLRCAAADKISGSISHLSTENSIMIDTGNFYMLKNVDSVIDLPLSTKESKSGSYIPVPFVQIILHGICDYTGTSINTGVNTKDVLLKYIEYGACPHYEWTYTALDPDDSSADPYYYDNTINSAADYYTDADKALNDLRAARITDHYEIEDGVFCTEYDTGSRIFVNYTDSRCNVLGIEVPAHDFIRVD